jgi:hypothetical protein
MLSHEKQVCSHYLFRAADRRNPMTVRTFVLIVLAAALTTPASAQLYFANDFNPTLYRLSTVNGAPTIVGASGVIPSTGFHVGLTDTPNPAKLLGSIPDFGLNYVNTDGSGVTFATSIIAEGLAYDGVGATYYGSRNGAFFSLDPVASTTTPLPFAPGHASIGDLAARNGIIYAVVGLFGPNQGDLLAYDPVPATWSLVGNTGIPFDGTGLAYNPLDGLLYAKGSQDTLLYSINPLNAATNIVGDTGLMWGGGLAYVVVPSPGALALLALGACGTARRRR